MSVSHCTDWHLARASMCLPSLDWSRRRLLHGDCFAYHNTNARPEHFCACAVSVEQHSMTVTIAGWKAALGRSGRDIYYFLQVAQSQCVTCALLMLLTFLIPCIPAWPGGVQSSAAQHDTA